MNALPFLPSQPEARAGLVPGLALVMGITLAATVHAQSDERRVLDVETLQIAAQPSFEKTRSFVGRVEAARSSELGFELAGTLTQMSADEGQHVSKGEVIAALDTARLEARRAQLAAGLEEAQASQHLAEVTLHRSEELVKSRATSEQSLDEARNQFATALARVKLVQAQIDQVDVDLGKSRLRAPFDGVISRRFVDEGTIISAGQPVLHILETSQLEIRVGVSSQAISSVDQGDTFQLETSGGPVGATVERILSQRDDQTRTIDVIMKVNASQANLRHGDLVQVPMSLESQENGYWIPRTALTESQRGLWACYVAVPSDKDGLMRLERRQVELLYANEERVFARGALQDGDHIVISGLQRLTPDQHVRRKPVSLTQR